MFWQIGYGICELFFFLLAHVTLILAAFVPPSKERLREEEHMESQRLERIELEERNLIHDTEAELMQPRARNNEKGDETSSLLNDLSRMEAQKDRLEAELSKLSQQLRDQKAQYQEDKSRAQAALHFHSQKEEVADQLQEESNSGKVNCWTWSWCCTMGSWWIQSWHSWHMLTH